MKLFITGATGFLGSELIPKLAGECEHLYLLVRKKSLSKAKFKFADYKNISFIIGDLTNPDLIEGQFDDLLEEVDTILHMGAYYDLEGSHKACFTQNIQGTLNLLFFASLCKNLKSLHYISTVAVSGNFKGEFLEDNFIHKEDFSNEYSKTKWEAERLVRTWKGEAKVRIYRPGIIIGNSKTGEFDKVDGPYYFWKTLSNFKAIAPLISKLPFLPMPINKSATLPIISIDNAARLIRNGIFLDNDFQLMTFHLVEHLCPNVFDLIGESLEEFSISADIKVINRHPLIDKTFEVLGLPKEIIHYMVTPIDYSVKNSIMYLGLNEQRGFENYKSIIFKKAKEVFGAKK
ncbi:SDR family oxidoreductase [Halobacteriovorax sp.]|uniref:SDR family oxidoreductase n=1 Tax=Halobacteriovorax sp. TaxID=2020862 RepID=UPI003561A709